MTTAHRARLARSLRRAAADDRGSLPMLMLVMIATTALGAIMMSTMLSASHTTQYSRARVLALNAAQSGIDAVVGQLRSATSSDNTATGDSGRLPCGPFASGSGTSASDSGVAPAAGNDSTTAYQATISYYDVDPTTLGTNDLTTPAPGGKMMLCTAAGTYNPGVSPAIRTPKFALITSTGTDSSSAGLTTRELQTVYNFKVLNQNIPGGTIALFPASSTQPTLYCMDAGSAPAVDSTVVLEPCSGSNPPASQQTWEYRADLSIELVSSVINPASAGLCIDTGTSPTSHSAGDPILLERCAVADASVCPAGTTPASYRDANPGKTCSVSPWNQQWSVDDAAHLRDARTDQSDTDNECINAGSQTAGTALSLADCQGGTTDPKQTWVPSPHAGAGMAGPGNNQLVNFQYFATCLDDTGQQVNASYMILYTCKQNPNPANVAFNQKFIPSPGLGTAPTQTLITVVQSGTTYCLRSPQTTGGYPVLVVQGSDPGECPPSVDVAGAGSPFVWTVSQHFADSSKTTVLSYANQYTIKDSSLTPLCLGPGGDNDELNNTYLKAVVTTCDGSDAQKWNATAITSEARLTNTTEVPNPTG